MKSINGSAFNKHPTIRPLAGWLDKPNLFLQQSLFLSFIVYVFFVFFLSISHDNVDRGLRSGWGDLALN